jgi:hypothetical protein
VHGICNICVSRWDVRFYVVELQDAPSHVEVQLRLQLVSLVYESML